jgi:hypothetical protein
VLPRTEILRHNFANEIGRGSWLILVRRRHPCARQ